ncbi:MAG: CHAT domain-containing protein [Alphaproteobacteria bacterium]|nr:CHAT domain-containing protein [Alphaproteobacteria bacterium]
MPRVVQLHITVRPEGGWRLTLGQIGARPVEGVLATDAVEALQSRLSALLEPPVVVHERSLAKVSRREQDVGGVLAEAIQRADLGTPWGRLIGVDGPVFVAVASDAPAVSRLPWELMAVSTRGPSLEEETGGLVVRLGHGRQARPQPPAERLRVLSWCPTPDDGDCQRVLRGMEAPTALHLGATPPVLEAGEAALLCLTCHGQQVAEGLLIDLGDAQAAPGTVSGLLAGLLPQVAAVVLAVCEGGAPTARQLEDLAERLLRAGAPAVICAARPLRPEAAGAFVQAFSGALARGERLPGAVRLGRQAVRALLQPHPDARPHTLQLRVADLGVLEQDPPIHRHWRPEGWPPVDPALGALLGRMAREAEARAHGWVGLEHLWLCLEAKDGGPLSRRMLQNLGVMSTILQNALFMGISEGHAATEGLRASPRLRALGGRLGPGADLDALWRVLADDPRHGLNLFVEQPLALLAAWDPDGSNPSRDRSRSLHPWGEGGPARGLEVLWGPEDGRVLALTPSQVLGRWHRDPKADVFLYADTASQDGNLSRAALQWLGDGRVALLAKHTRVLSGPAQAGAVAFGAVERRGAVDLALGDVVMLTRGTWVRGVPDAP